MKRLLLKPGFEGIFALSIIAIIGLPPLVMGQDKKEQVVTKQIEIKIKDGDTVINGKNLKNLSAAEREEALGDMQVFDGNIIVKGHPKHSRDEKRVVIRRKGKGDKKDVIIERKGGPGEGEFQVFSDDEDFTVTDTLGKKLGIKLKKLRDVPGFAFDYKMNDDFHGPEFKTFDGPQVREFRLGRSFDNFSRPNSQSFSYTNTDDEGISTNVSYRVNDASKEKLSSIAGVDKAELAIKDIGLSPEFSTGKTVLSFNLPAKTVADVQFKDSQGKVLWSDKTSTGSFNKAFTLGLNGAYYLQVKQGSSVAVKRIVKED